MKRKKRPQQIFGLIFIYFITILIVLSFNNRTYEKNKYKGEKFFQRKFFNTILFLII